MTHPLIFYRAGAGGDLADMGIVALGRLSLIGVPVALLIDQDRHGGPPLNSLDRFFHFLIIQENTQGVGVFLLANTSAFFRAAASIFSKEE